jgi:hypothetical protein
MEFQHSKEVWNISPIAWEKAVENEMSERIYNILLKWIPFADSQFSSRWNTRPNCGHFFGGSYWYGSETAHTAAVYAALATLGPYREDITGIPRNEVKEKAIKAIRYLGFTHDTRPEDCVRDVGPNPHCSEKKWGSKNDGFFMASQTGRTVANFALAAWLLWNDLDDETKMLVQDVVAWYADRWSVESPRDGSFFDTQCEENAWTAQGICVALAMFPDHPHRKVWEDGFIRWSINACTTHDDRFNEELYKEKAIRYWVHCVTLFPDYTTENHGFVHPSYLSAGINLRALHALLSIMSNQEILESALYKNEKIYENALKIFTQFDGLVIPIQGQDWWYNRQHERQLTHTVLNVMHNNSDAARLCRNALSSIEKIQDSNSKGCLLEERGEECVIRPRLQFAKDMEHGSAADLLFSYLFYLFGGIGAEPSDQHEMMERLSGVYYFPFGSLIVHRRRDSFASFSWRNNCMGLCLPEAGMWNITPIFSSFTGHIVFSDKKGVQGLSNETFIRNTLRHNQTVKSDGFAACATISRGDNEILQDVAFVSLPSGEAVYIEQLNIKKDCENVTIETGLIGIRNENLPAAPDLGPGEVQFYTDSTKRSYPGFYGNEPDVIEDFKPSKFVNVNNTMGYILSGSSGIRYINKHVYPHWKGVEDRLILNYVGKKSFMEKDSIPPFVVMAMPNKTYQETAMSVSDLTVMNSKCPNTILLIAKEYLVVSNFNDSVTDAAGVFEIKKGSVKIFKGINRIINKHYVWHGELPKFSSDYYPCLYEIKSVDFLRFNLHVFATKEKVYFENISDRKIEFTLCNSYGEDLKNIRLDANSIYVWNSSKS